MSDRLEGSNDSLIDTLPLKSKKRGNIRNPIREEHTESAARSVKIFEDDIHRVECASGVKEDNTGWSREESVHSSGSVLVSSTQLFMENLSSSIRPDNPETLAEETVPSQRSHIDASKNHKVDLFEEPAKGTAGFLKRLKEQGCLATDSESKDTKFSFDLTYRDKDGNELTPKEAYKELSRKFHGTGLGKRRMEKKLKQKCGIFKPRS